MTATANESHRPPWRRTEAFVHGMTPDEAALVALARKAQARREAYELGSDSGGAQLGYSDYEPHLAAEIASMLPCPRNDASNELSGDRRRAGRSSGDPLPVEHPPIDHVSAPRASDSEHQKSWERRPWSAFVAGAHIVLAVALDQVVKRQRDRALPA